MRTLRVARGERGAHLPLRRGCRLHVAGLLLVLLTLVLPAQGFALADAPGTRGPQPLGQGGVGVQPAGAAIGSRWQGVRELPPHGAAPFGPAAPNARPLRQDETGGGAIAWLGRQLNPGNWILDAGMGIFAGILKMFGGIVQKSVQSLVGPSILPAGCDNAATNFVFCTPARLTYGHPGVQLVWGVLRGIAASLVTILFTVRLGRMIVEGPRSLAAEGKSVLLTFLASMIFIQATGPICQLIIDFFNGLSTLLLANAALAFPLADVGDLDFGAVVLFLVLWVIILILIVKSFTRLVQIIILISVAPLAGALLMDRATSARFRSWFEKLVELLLAQINLAILFIVIAAILRPYDEQGAGDQFVAFLLAIVAMGMALSGKSLIGVAGAAMSGGGAGMLSFLRYQVAGSALRGLAGGRRDGASRLAATSGGMAPDVREAVDAAQQAAQGASARSSRTSGDPAQSAAAQRQASGGDHTPHPAGAFSRAGQADTLTSRRASARYAAAEAQHADGVLPLSARREQALMRATLMRQRATELRGQGDALGAGALAQRARRQEAFGRGRDVTRPSRFSGADRAQRRAAYGQALAEVQGMHALERDSLTQQIGRDEARLPIVQRELGLAGATGGDTTGLYAEQQAIQARLAASRARLGTIAPGEDGGPARATRAAAAALANDRLPQRLRSQAEALRQSAPHGSAFVQRLTRAPTQAAHDELATTRAHAARLAQTPADQRPPISTPRRQLPRGRLKRPNSAPGSAPGQRSRAPSSTIARLRAHRQRMGDGRAHPADLDGLRQGSGDEPGADTTDGLGDDV